MTTSIKFEKVSHAADGSPRPLKAGVTITGVELELKSDWNVALTGLVLPRIGSLVYTT